MNWSQASIQKHARLNDLEGENLQLQYFEVHVIFVTL